MQPESSWGSDEEEQQIVDSQKQNAVAPDDHERNSEPEKNPERAETTAYSQVVDSSHEPAYALDTESF